MNTVAHLYRSNHGPKFRAFSLREEDPDILDPFLGIDHAWMSEPTFPPHPHAGFSAVSYLFMDSETGIANRDSLGNSNYIQPGGLHWTTAGQGIIHEEIPAELGKTVHMLQIFVNLPESHQKKEPFTLSLSSDEVPVVHYEGIRIRIPLGHFYDKRSPLRPPTEVRLLDILFEPGAELEIPIMAGENAFILPIYGDFFINEKTHNPSHLQIPVMTANEETSVIRLKAGSNKTKVVVFAGKPLKQPVYWQGSLALASREALLEAHINFQKGRFGRL